MKICFLADTDSIHSQRWVKAMVEKGLQVYVISPSKNKVTGSIHITYPSRTHLHSGPWPIRYLIKTICVEIIGRFPFLSVVPIKLLSHYSVFPEFIIDTISKINPDIVHLHYLSRMDDTLAVASGLIKKKIIISVWGDDVEEQSGKFDRQTKLIRRAALLSSDKVTATSSYLMELTNKLEPNLKDISVIPFGVDVSKFVSPGKKKQTIKIGFVKHLNSFYGADDYLMMAKEINKIYPKIQFLMVGDGDYKKYKKISNNYGIEGNVTILGEIPNDKINKIYKDLYLLVMPSKFDVFGVSAVEAQSTGVPVIAYDVGGLRETIQNNKTGILVAPGNVRKLIESVSRIISDENLYFNLSMSARDYVLKKYNWNNNVAQMVEIYKRVINDKS